MYVLICRLQFLITDFNKMKKRNFIANIFPILTNFTIYGLILYFILSKYKFMPKFLSQTEEALTKKKRRWKPKGRQVDDTSYQEIVLLP